MAVNVLTVVMLVPVHAASRKHTQLSHKRPTEWPAEHTNSSLVTAYRCQNYNRTLVNIWRSDPLQIYCDRHHVTERTATVNTIHLIT